MERPAGNKSRRLFLRFLESPIEICGGDRMDKVVLEQNKLTGDPGRQKSTGTGNTRELDCGLLFRSVGYRGSAIPGVPFHEQWGIIYNEAGRVTDDGKVVPGLYTAGWIKRGPSGVIGTNKPDAVETVTCMLRDLDQGITLNPPHPDTTAVEQLVRQRQPKFFSYQDWLRLDEIEVARGQAAGRPRVKFTCVQDMLAALGR